MVDHEEQGTIHTKGDSNVLTTKIFCESQVFILFSLFLKHPGNGTY